MITLVTGTPGAGKTLWVVSQLMRLYYPSRSIFKFLIDFVRGVKPEPPSKRLLYVHGIPALNLGFPYVQLYCHSPLCDVCASAVFTVPEPLFNAKGEYVNWREVEEAEAKRNAVLYLEDWPTWAQDGCIIVADEVQRIWRPRSAASAVPADISAFETHRHRGIDFWLISQSSKLIDQNIRRLVNRHVHLVASWKGRMQYEWSECKDNVNSKTDAVSRPYVLDRSIFSRYLSATVHTKIDRRPPLQLFVIFIASALLVYILYDVYSRHYPDSEAVVPVVSPSPSPAAPVGSQTSLATFSAPALPVPSPDVLDFTPRKPGRPETAPAYDGQLRIQSVPYPTSCASWAIGTEWHCRCTTDQGTPYSMPLDSCLAYARGEVYNPYIPPSTVAQLTPVSSSPYTANPPKN